MVPFEHVRTQKEASQSIQSNPYVSPEKQRRMRKYTSKLLPLLCLTLMAQSLMAINTKPQILPLSIQNARPAHDHPRVYPFKAINTPKTPKQPRNDKTGPGLGILALTFGLLGCALIFPFIGFAYIAAVTGVYTGLAIILGASELLLGVAGIILGVQGSAKIRKGKAVAIIGIILSAIALLPVLMFVPAIPL
jgi:sulfite exporter TauE/SafE